MTYNRGQLDEDQQFPRSSSNNRFPAQEAYPDYSWETIMCWSWSYTESIDWLQTQDYVDMKGMVVTGQSRRGRTAWLGGIMDERIALAVPAGRFKVSISPARIMTKGTGDSPPDEIPDPAVKNIPKKYWTQEKSGLNADVAKGERTIDFELK